MLRELALLLGCWLARSSPPTRSNLYHLAPMNDVARALDIFFGGPFLFVTSAMMGTLVFYLRNTPAPWEWLIVALGAAAMRYWLNVHGGALAEASIVGAYLWATAFTLTLLAPFAYPGQMQARLSTLRLMGLPPLALFLLTLALIRLGTWLPGPTFDDELYGVDAHFGYPAFAVAAWVMRRPLLHELSKAVYIHLPLLATLLYARLLDSPGAERRYLTALILVVVIGGLSYRLVPGAGTIATFNEAFPWHAPQAAPTGPPPGVEWPRNCVPSVHLACAIVMALAAPRRTWFSGFAWAFVAATCASTLVDGGHYVIDLIVAVPFAVTVWLGVNRRWAVCAVATVVWALWVGALRGHMVSTAPSLVVWGASALTIVLSAAIARRSQIVAEIDEAETYVSAPA